MFSEDATRFFPTLDFRTGERAVTHEGFDYHGPDVPFKGVRAFLHDFAMEQPRAELRPNGGYRVIVGYESLAEFMDDERAERTLACVRSAEADLLLDREPDAIACAWAPYMAMPEDC